MTGLQQHSKRYAVHLALNLEAAVGRAVMEGVGDVVHRRHDWRFSYTAPNHAASPEDCDAVLGVVMPAIADLWRGEHRRRVVNVSRNRFISGAANVRCDDRRIGRLAAEHLLGKGPFAGFAFIGPANSGDRCRSFVDALAEQGVDCRAYVDDQLWDAIPQWLGELPHPCGLFVYNDQIAAAVIDQATMMGLGVPRDLAVVGVDNDTILSRFAAVSLTSIDPDFNQVGRRGAELLSGLLDGDEPPAEAIVVPPRGVVERYSTDFPGLADTLAVRAARLIRERACDGINVARLVDMLPGTRRTLERRFHAAFGRTLHEEIQARRLESAAALLRQTDLTIDAISRRAGFANASHFSAAFRKQVGATPGQFRRNSHNDAGDAQPPLPDGR